jgi:glutamine synthetase
LAYALLIWAAMDGITGKLSLPPSADLNLFTADRETQARFARLPESKEAAAALAASSDFLRAYLPRTLIDSYCL